MKNYIIGILSVLVLVLGGYIVYDKVIDKKTVKEDSKQTVYKVYKKGDQITLSDGRKYTVLEDSAKTKDYVTAISNVSYYFSASDTTNTQTEVYITNTTAYSELEEALYNSKGSFSYDTALTKVLDIVNTYFIKLNSSDLKEVNGYKVRLLTLDDLYAYYGEGSFTKATYSINYIGTEKIFKTLTMIDSKTLSTANDKKMTLATISSGTDNGDSIVGYTLGVPGINPVINVYKNSIK